MAVSESNKYSNALVGTPFVGGDVDIYEEHTSPKWQIGTGFKRQDGAEFRYAHFGGVMTKAGLLCAQDFSESSSAQMDSLCVTPANATMVPGYNIKPNEIGSKHIQVTVGSSNIGTLWSGGYLMVGNGTGEGYTYRIIDSYDGHVTGSTLFTIAGKLQIALDATSDVVLFGSPYSNLESTPATLGTDVGVVGVNCAKHTTAGRWGWIQTKGVVGILRDASTIAAGTIIRVSAEDKGAISGMDRSAGHLEACMGSTVFNNPIVGYCIDPGADTEFSLCYVNII